MIYFYLNTENFIDPMFNGISNNLGAIKLSFFQNALDDIIRRNILMNAWSEDPQFKNIDILKNKKIILDMINNESINMTNDEIIAKIESAHKIVLPIIGKSLDELGLHYDYIATIDNKSVENDLLDWMSENNFQCVEESIGKPNMSLQEKIDFLTAELKNINSQGNIVLIVDPYIFPKNHDDDYIELFCGVMEKCKASAIKVITNKSNCNTDLQQKIKEQLDLDLSVHYSKDLHDRWWIVENDNKGFTSGPSLNGIGKDKLTTIKQLDEDEVKTILSSFKNLV